MVNIVLVLILVLVLVLVLVLILVLVLVLVLVLILVLIVMMMMMMLCAINRTGFDFCSKKHGYNHNLTEAKQENVHCCRPSSSNLGIFVRVFKISWRSTQVTGYIRLLCRVLFVTKFVNTVEPPISAYGRWLLMRA